MELDIYSLNTAIKACCVGDVPMKGLDLIHSSEVWPDLVSYNTMIWAYAKLGDRKSCEDILTMMGNHTNVKPDHHTSTALLKAGLVAEKPGACISSMQSIWNQHQVRAREPRIYDSRTASERHHSSLRSLCCSSRV